MCLNVTFYQMLKNSFTDIQINRAHTAYISTDSKSLNDIKILFIIRIIELGLHKDYNEGFIIKLSYTC